MLKLLFKASKFQQYFTSCFKVYCYYANELLLSNDLSYLTTLIISPLYSSPFPKETKPKAQKSEVNKERKASQCKNTITTEVNTIQFPHPSIFPLSPLSFLAVPSTTNTLHNPEVKTQVLNLTIPPLKNDPDVNILSKDIPYVTPSYH